jgi:RNA polymerase sigma-70 factor (ECF subfamily)
VVLSKLDRILLDRCLSGSQGAWQEFIERFLPLLVHVVNHTSRQRFKNLPQAWRDDLVAEVLLSVVEDDFAVLRRFRGNSSLGTYLVVVARRVAARKLSKIRRASKELNRTSNWEPAEPHDSISEFTQRDLVENLLERLPKQEAQAIRLFHFEHQSYAEIGSHLGVPENSVGPLLSRARKLMRAIEAQDQTA